ncbi:MULTISPECIES: hypothetical protein [Halostella]|uniref:hypothetical protein n=1 Tax=Halostella TaxID=1843185 RepID=UPI00107FE4C9|nr:MULTISPECIES: hypothetical protein [Halostella]
MSDDERSVVVDPDAAADRIRRRAESVRRAELDDALGKLETTDGLTPGQRRAVRRMSERITETLIASPMSSLRTADDAETVAVAVELFGGDDGRADQS